MLCCHLVSENEASAGRICSSARQYLLVRVWTFTHADIFDCVCRDGRIASLSVDSASPVTVLTSPGATHLDSDGHLWLGQVCLSQHHRCH